MSEEPSILMSLLDRLRAGDPAAHNDLIGYSRARFRRLTHQMLRNFPGVRRLEETSDVLQLALIRLDSVLRDVPIASPQDFLRLAATQVRRQLIDLTRHYFGPRGLGANQLPPGQGKEGVTPPEPSDSSAEAGKLEKWENFHSQIDGLDEKYRELFDLLYYQEMTQAEAAAWLGISLSTLKRHWQEARLELMKCLGDDLPISCRQK